jgi:hypothetical protein
MRILLIKASDGRFKEIRESQTAQDILKIMEEFNEAIIIEKGGYFNTKKIDENGEIIIDENFDYTITIYDYDVE